MYITKYWDSKHTCLLGGPYDVPDRVPAIPREQIADWFLDESKVVDLSKIRALTSADDANYAEFVLAYGVLNLQEGVHWESFTAASYTDREGETVNGHSAVVQDPSFKQQRYEACFSSARN